MQIKQKIESDYQQALKNKDALRVSTLRMLKSAIHNREIEKAHQALSDPEILKIIAKQLAQRKDSIEQFKKGKREDLAAKESQELEILKAYLPEQLKPEEITAAIKSIIAQLPEEEQADIGKVMRAAMPELSGKADGALVSRIVSELLNLKKDKK
ncbi:MAG: GatB/YqeY domain-containing protein [Candidatus Omnitrophica bacterium]|nr:GatB/YqeY domain-containing protein [Candidatus Omnitrophota bacterium]